MPNQKPIYSFRDLDVYQGAYSASIVVMTRIIPKLPSRERFDLVDQLSRSSKAVPRLIAEGFAKKHQKAGFQKYLDDAMAETNETSVSIEQRRDIYPNNVELQLCNELVDQYDKIGRQLYNLLRAWNGFKHTERRTTANDTGRDRR